MNINERDRRALAILAAAAVAALVMRFAFSGGSAKPVAPSDSIPAAEKRLAHVRQLAASVPGKRENLKRVSAELAQREKSLIQAATAPQAQAQVLEIVRRLAKAETPPLELKTGEIGQVRPLGDAYGEVVVPVSFDCRIEQLVNLLADITAQPEILATTEIRILSGSSKDKSMSVRLTVSGVVPRSLVPEKKGPFSF
jgi:hypothetical protein